MTDRERLIELKINFVENFDCGDCKPSNNKCRKCLSEKEADYLLEHGVIVPLCKVGDMLYYPRIYDDNIGIDFAEVENIKIYVNGMPIVFVKELGGDINSSTAFYPANFGETVFLTKEQAEQKLKEMRVENDL